MVGRGTARVGGGESGITIGSWDEPPREEACALPDGPAFEDCEYFGAFAI